MPPQRTKKGRWAPDTAHTYKRGPWNITEDDQLRSLVKEKGPGKWVAIAEVLVTRSPKQCRERWHQNLKPDLNHEPITEEEGKKIEELVLTMGKKWADIAREMHNRSDNAVKNWWNGGENRRKREQTRAQDASRMHPYQGVTYHQPAPQTMSYIPHPTEPAYWNRLRLPPLPSAPRGPPPVMLPDRHYPIDPAEPSPLSARPPSLVSDAGSEPIHQGAFHSHRTSFNGPTHHRVASIDMHRSISNETHWSPVYEQYRVSNTREDASTYHTNIIHEPKLPPLQTLTQPSVHSSPTVTAGANGSPQPPRSPTTPTGYAQESLELAPLQMDQTRQTTPPEESKARMSVHNLIG